jgi:hypothetical protein
LSQGARLGRGAPGGDEWLVAGHYVFELERSSAERRIRKMKPEAFHQSGNLGLLPPP